MMSTALPPPLREGDRLNSTEFLRRWDAMPDLRHAELIDGVVFMASPVSNPHAAAHSEMGGWLWLYKSLTPGCATGNDATLMLASGNVPQPDVHLRLLPQYGGQSSNEGSYVAGAPELVVEVTGSTVSRDLGIKLNAYQKAGVKEYLTVLLNPKQVIWRRLVRSRYQEIQPNEDSLLRSHAFPGLWLDPDAVWNPEKQTLSDLQLGLQSPEHAAFVERLRKAAARA